MRVSWKQGQLLPTFDDTITLLNKLSAHDSLTKLDVWKKTVIHNCFFKSQTVRNINGTTVSLGSSFLCRVPKSPDYVPYSKWREDIAQGFTFSVGDIIIRGEIEETDINPNNVTQILTKYRPEAFRISAFSDNTGKIEALEHYRIEGV